MSNTAHVVKKEISKMFLCQIEEYTNYCSLQNWIQQDELQAWGGGRESHIKVTGLIVDYLSGVKICGLIPFRVLKSELISVGDMLVTFTRVLNQKI